MPIDSLGSSPTFPSPQEVLRSLPDSIREAHNESVAAPPASGVPEPPGSSALAALPESSQLRQARQIVADFLSGRCDPSRMVEEIALLVVGDLLDDLNAQDYPGLRDHIIHTVEQDPTVLAEIREILRDVARTLPPASPP